MFASSCWFIFVLSYASQTAYQLTELTQIAECIDPSASPSQNESISLQNCIDICQSKSFDDCIMIQYYDDIAGTSRCYIFNELCDLTYDVPQYRIYSSHVYYKNQLYRQFCTDYYSFNNNGDRIEWEDKFGLTCSKYQQTEYVHVFYFCN